MTQRSIIRILILVAIVAFAVGAVYPGSLRIALLSDAVVLNDSVFLSDLLPQNTPAPIRKSCASISLGNAPQNNSTRHIDRESIAFALQSAGMAPSDFLIPQTIRVRRSGHIVTLQESLAAIHAELDKNPRSGLSPAGLTNVAMTSSLLLPQGDPQLRVTEISYDQLTSRARFRLSAKSAPNTVPFFVTAAIPANALPSSVASGKSLQTTFSAKSLSSNLSQKTLPVLIQTGHSARLHLHSQNSDILLDVVPLQKGYLNQTIRVRMPGNAKTLRARVIGEGSLDAAF